MFSAEYPDRVDNLLQRSSTRGNGITPSPGVTTSWVLPTRSRPPRAPALRRNDGGLFGGCRNSSSDITWESCFLGLNQRRERDARTERRIRTNLLLQFHVHVVDHLRRTAAAATCSVKPG